MGDPLLPASGLSAFLDRLRSAPLDPAAVAAWIAGLPLDAAEIAALRAPDLSRPYGRRVLVTGGGVEVMLATWSPGARCAPHDHGGATGAVRVLAGRCAHFVYRPAGADLEEVSVGLHGAGDVLDASQDLVHAMEDLDPAEPLITLHVYVPGIPRMVVYDVEGGRTLLLGGDCGAWVPDDPATILSSVAGFVPPSEVMGR